MLVEQIPVASGMSAHCAYQPVHLAQRLFALALAVGFIPGVGHLDAQLVDAPDETLGCLHPVLEPLATNELDGLHQGAGGVPQQHPIDRIVNGGAQAGGIQEGAFQIQRLGQVQLRWGGSPQGQELINEWAHFGLGPPLVIALNRALAGHLHQVDPANATEVLEQRAVGQADGKAPVVLPEQSPSDIATQCALAVKLMVLLSWRTELFASAQPAAQVGFQELSFQTTFDEQCVDVQQLIAPLAIIDITLDGGQDLRQGRLEGNNNSSGHGDSLYSIVCSASTN